MSNEKWSEWLPNRGVQPNHKAVEVKFDDGTTDIDDADMYYWPIDGDSCCDIIAYRYRIQENEMHPDLKWLALNVSEWPEGCKVAQEYSGKADFLMHFDEDDADGEITFTKPQWLQARKDLGLIMTESEEELPAEEWSTTITDTPEEAAMVEDMANPAWSESAPSGAGKYSAYYKDVRHIKYIDVYRTVDLFECEKHGHPISHAAKKLLLSGSRTGGKDVESDVREAIDTLYRWLEMREEDQNAM